MVKYKLLTLILIISISISSGSAVFKQGAGISQDVHANVDRAPNKTTKEKTQLYCAQKDIGFCDEMKEIGTEEKMRVYCMQADIYWCKEDVSTTESIIIQLGLADIYTDILNLISPDNSNTSNVQTIG